MNGSTIRLEFPAKAEYLILARLALAGVSRTVPIGQEALADLKLAVTEACGNAIRHAYDEAEPGAVRLVLDVEADAIRVLVADEGTGGGAEAGGSWPAEDLPEGGMGLAIIRALAEEVSVGQGADGKGTVVRFTKRLAPPQDV